MGEGLIPPVGGPLHWAWLPRYRIGSRVGGHATGRRGRGALTSSGATPQRKRSSVGRVADLGFMAVKTVHSLRLLRARNRISTNGGEGGVGVWGEIIADGDRHGERAGAFWW